MAALTRKIRRLAALIALCLAMAPAAASFADAPSEYDIKAVFLYNFANFVEWPATVDDAATAEFAICVLGDNPFDGSLEEAIAGERVGERSLVVRSLSSVDDAAGCRMVFIGDEFADELSDILRSFAERPVLTVGESLGFARLGGGIGFHEEERRIRFEINLDAVGRSGLRVSSQLLKLATRVYGTVTEGD